MTSKILGTLLLTLTLVLGTPVQHSPRAGGPIAKPIPSNCSLETVTLQGTGSSVPGPDSYGFANPDLAPADGFGPSDAFRNAQTTYSYFLPDESSQPAWNESAHVQQCLQQCYGFGGPCAGIAWGHNVVGLTYGIRVEELACLFLAQPVQAQDLVPVTNGSWTGALAINIICE